MRNAVKSQAAKPRLAELRRPCHSSLTPPSFSFRQLIDGIYRISTAIYKPTFLEIGYAGRFTKRSIHKWPTWEFDASGIAHPSPPPPTPAPSAPAAEPTAAPVAVNGVPASSPETTPTIPPSESAGPSQLPTL